MKKLPAKKAGARGRAKAADRIAIEVKARQDFSSLVEMARRKLTGCPLSPMPSDLRPMLATLVDEAFNDKDWIFELKLDGYRALGYVNNGQAELSSRNGNSFNQKFSPVHEALGLWGINAVVDGEIVVLNESGRPDFNGIQQWHKKKKGQLVYYLFDLLWLDGIDLTGQPLLLRREILKQLIPDSGAIRFSDHIEEVGIDFFEAAWNNGLEGIVAKKKDSTYATGARSKSWLKIKVEQKHEAVICGYTRKKDTDRLFSSLLLGVYRQGSLHYLGQAGTGYTIELQKELSEKMRPLVTRDCPFGKEPELAEEPVWLKPFLVCEVKYTELTSEGVMRHGSFQALREDKAAFELNDEEPQALREVLADTVEGPHLLANGSQKEVIVIKEGHELKLTNLKKIYWPREKISKGDLLNYYDRIAEYIMPYMKDRPQSLNRFPDGIEGESFYHKNMGGKAEKWLKTFSRVSESSGEPKEFLICSDAASLLYMANLGCIEMNPWHSRVQSPLYPDWSVIDLDPGNISFNKVIETAIMVKKVLDSLQVPSFPKTSGSTGIHIYIPLAAKYNYEQSRQLAELIATLVHQELPQSTSLLRNPRKRSDKIYIDYLQNRPIQTICAPYSVRPRPGATVSAPLHWDEVRKGLSISQFTMRTVFERLAIEGDLFYGVMGKGIDLNKILKGLSSLI
ncbi:MAG TPA: DNA ligase D [Flavisolibacter sp.]|nr:DNA ligase D [Flavisolibacter sp.]